MCPSSTCSAWWDRRPLLGCDRSTWWRAAYYGAARCATRTTYGLSVQKPSSVTERCSKAMGAALASQTDVVSVTAAANLSRRGEGRYDDECGVGVGSDGGKCVGLKVLSFNVRTLKVKKRDRGGDAVYKQQRLISARTAAPYQSAHVLLSRHREENIVHFYLQSHSNSFLFWNGSFLRYSSISTIDGI